MGKDEFRQTEEHKLVFNELLYKKKRNFSLLLLLFFTSIYFFAAIITTSEFKELAALNILGLPLAFYAGVLVFIAGVVVTRLYLLKTIKGWR